MLHQKLNEAEDFNVQELVMYDLHYLDKRTASILEPLFGKGRGETSFYDGNDIYEVKIRPTASEEYLNNLNSLCDVMKEKAELYDLQIIEPYPLAHYNISVWRDGANLFDPEHPYYMTTGHNIASGIQQGLYTLYDEQDKDMGSSRAHHLRLCGEKDRGRLELRFLTDTISVSRIPFMIEGAVKAGILHGLLTHGESDPQERAVFSRDTDEFKMSLHTLQGSTLVPTTDPDEFYLNPPRSYIYYSSNFEDIAQELRIPFMHPAALIESSDEIILKNLKPSLSAEYVQKMRDMKSMLTPEDIAFIDSISVTDGNVTLPPDEDILKYYHTKRASALKAYSSSEQIVQFFSDIRVRKDGDQFNIIWPDYTTAGGDYRHLECKEELQQGIACDGIVPSFERLSAKVDKSLSPTVFSGLTDELTHYVVKRSAAKQAVVNESSVAR